MSRTKWTIAIVFTVLVVAWHMRFSKGGELRANQETVIRDPVKDKENYMRQTAARKAAEEREKIAEQARAKAAAQLSPEEMPVPANTEALQNLARDLIVDADPKKAVAAKRAAAADQEGDTPDVGADAPKAYVTKLGETLFTVAEKALGDRRRWQQIAELNDPSTRPGTALPAGTRLVLPPREAVNQ